MSVWDNFYRLTHLRIDFPNVTKKTAEIYGNRRNQVEVMITLRVVDKNQLPLPLKEIDLEEHVYLCDYYTGKDVSIPWSVANQDNGYNKVISYHSFSDNENKHDIADEDGFIRIHKFISCDRQDNGIVIAAGINIPEVGKFNTSMFGTTTRNGTKGKEGKVFKNPQYVNVISKEPIVYSSKSNFEVELSDFRYVKNFNYSAVGRDAPNYSSDGDYSDGKISIRTIKIKPKETVFGNNFFKEYLFDKDPIDQNKIDNTGKYFKLFPEGYVTPYSVLQKDNGVVFMYLGHNHVKIEGHFSLYESLLNNIYRIPGYDYDCKPDIEINHMSSHNGKEIILYLYKFNVTSMNCENKGCSISWGTSGWTDGPREITMKVTDSYGNTGALTLIFDKEHFGEPGFFPAIEEVKNH